MRGLDWGACPVLLAEVPTEGWCPCFKSHSGRLPGSRQLEEGKGDGVSHSLGHLSPYRPGLRTLVGFPLFLVGGGGSGSITMATKVSMGGSAQERPSCFT